MNLNEAKEILNNNGYFLKEDARRNNTDISDIFSLIDVHDWSPKWVSEKIMKHYYPTTVDYIDETNYKDYIGEYINVKENVELERLNLTKLPIRFGTVGGNFYCGDNKLTSLEGAPNRVVGDFICGDNKLTSLEGAPKVVGGNFYCGDNKLTSLEGAPEKVGGSFDCEVNKLTSLEGAPKVVDGDFCCNDNYYLTSIKGAPKEIGKNFIIWNPNITLTKDEILKVSNVKGKIEL